MELNFRKLRADEIQVRAKHTSQKGRAKLLLYKDARVDMTILDETCGQMGWQRKHEILNGVNYCSIGIKDTDTGEWLWKSDCGIADGTMEKEKSEASDAMKRACTTWGIGRELYNIPPIFVSTTDYQVDGNGDPKGYFKVNDIEWDGDYLVFLEIADSKGRVVYGTHTAQEQQQPQYTPKKDYKKPSKKEFKKKNDTEAMLDALITFCTDEREQEGADMEKIVRFFDYYSEKINNKGWTGGTMDLPTLFDKFK